MLYFSETGRFQSGAMRIAIGSLGTVPDRIVSVIFAELTVSRFWGAEGSITELIEKMEEVGGEVPSELNRGRGLDLRSSRILNNLAI